MSKGESKSILPPGTLSSVDPQCEERFLDNILSQGDSYEALKNASSGGTHFQFKFEKSWTLADVPVNSRFRVQISVMSENFSKIPFSERRSMFWRYCSKDPELSDGYSLDNLVSTYVTSGLSTENWITSISKKLDELDQESIDNVHTVPENNKSPTIPSIIAVKECTNNDASTNQSFGNSTPENSNQQTKLKENEKHNLEDWLDSILDD